MINHGLGVNKYTLTHIGKSIFSPDATSGATDDWAKGVAGIKYTICPELRGTNFIINRDQITPSFEEIWAGLVAQEGGLPRT